MKIIIMKKKFKKLALVLTFNLISMPVFAASGIWNTNEIKLPIIKDKLSYRVFNRSYFTDKSLGIDSMILRTGPIINFTDNFSLALHTSFAGFNREGNKFVQEVRYEIEPNFDFIFDRFKISDRNRFEVRVFDKVSFRYRNNLSISYKLDFPITPYISDEIFISPTEKPSNRFTLGVSYPVTKEVKFNIGYMHMSSMQNDNTWNNSPTLVLSFLSDLTK